MVKINKHLRNTANIEYIVIYWIYINKQWRILIWYLEILFAQPQGNVDGRDKKTENRKTEN